MIPGFVLHNALWAALPNHGRSHDLRVSTVLPSLENGEFAVVSGEQDLDTTGKRFIRVSDNADIFRFHPQFLPLVNYLLPLQLLAC